MRKLFFCTFQHLSFKLWDMLGVPGLKTDTSIVKTQQSAEIYTTKCFKQPLKHDGTHFAPSNTNLNLVLKGLLEQATESCTEPNLCNTTFTHNIQQSLLSNMARHE